MCRYGVGRSYSDAGLYLLVGRTRRLAVIDTIVTIARLVGPPIEKRRWDFHIQGVMTRLPII
jgi:hypothetical protein